MSLLFVFCGHIVPIMGGFIADTKLGRYKTISIGVAIGLVAHVVMIGDAAPAILKAGNGLAPFIVSFFLLALGAGIFKPNVMPLVVDQYAQPREYVKTLKSGERVIVDPESTVQRVMLIFYSCINVGAFFAIPSTYTEKYVGFWLAFLIPGGIYLLLPVLLWAMYGRTIQKPPQGSELIQFFKITTTALKQNRFRIWAPRFWDAALPSVLLSKGITVPWTDKLVRDVARTYEACIIFLYFPLYQMNNGGIGAVASNQGAAMTSKGVPNDLLGNFNQIAVITATPLMTYGIYPFLARRRIRFGRIRRMTFGFLLAATSGVAGAVVQYRVYQTSPCGWEASTCDKGVSHLSIWWQLPNVVLGAVSEVFCNVTAYELAYARAPPNLKSMVVSMFLLTTALSSAASQTILPAVEDPHLVVRVLLRLSFPLLTGCNC
jgi:proton-dependent oligopeptide transporter, POT family